VKKRGMGAFGDGAVMGGEGDRLRTRLA